MTNLDHAGLGQYLTTARNRSGLTQNQVAEKFGYSSAALISKWEMGIYSPPLNALAQLMRIYGSNPEELVFALFAEQKRILRRRSVNRGNESTITMVTKPPLSKIHAKATDKDHYRNAPKDTVHLFDGMFPTDPKN